MLALCLSRLLWFAVSPEKVEHCSVECDAVLLNKASAIDWV